jgi:hypothetical protein
LIAGPTQTEAIQALGLEMLAHILFGQGRWREAQAALGRLERLEPARAAHARAAMVTAPWFAPAPRDVATARAAFRALPLTPEPGDSAPLDPRRFAVPRQVYYVGLLDLLGGDTVPAATAAQRLTSESGDAEQAVYSRGLGAALKARMAWRAGDPARALEALESGWPPSRRGVQQGWSWSYAQSSQRYLRAALLEELGRTEEALRWIESTDEDIGGTPSLLPWALALRSRQLDRLGRTAEAARLRAQVEANLRQADPGVATPVAHR